MLNTLSTSPSFLILSANTPWVYALGENLGADHAVHAVRLYDWNTYRDVEPEWPTSPSNSAIQRTLRVMPPGYTGRLRWFFRPIMMAMIRWWWNALRERSGSDPWVIAPYPYLAPWLSSIPDERLVYYNLDAYALYRPERRQRIRANEETLVQRAARTVCLSQFQVSRLRSRHPQHADRIRHFPLGVVEAFLNEDAADGAPPIPKTVTYVGNLGDRVDWELVRDVTRAAPDLTFRFVGSVGEGPDEGWRAARTRVFQQSNVEAVGRVPQSDVYEYFGTSSVNWIPYDTEHPFNRASCPTKIMDGIASGRPIVSTSVPECTLYPEWIDIADTPGDIVSALRHHADTFDPDRARRQVNAARSHTWQHRATELVHQLSSPQQDSHLAASS